MGTLLRFLFAAAAFQLSYSAPVDFLAPQTLPAGCRLEVITVQEEVEETKVEKVVCETEFRPTCNIKLEKNCKNVTRPACQVEEKMECVQSTVSQCSTETRIGSTGEEEQVEVCRDIPIEDCQLVKEEKCIDGELEGVEECDEKEVEECEIVPHEECHQVTVDLPRLQDKQVQQIFCDEENEIEDSVTTENELPSPPSSRCGSPSRSMMSAAHPVSTASASNFLLLKLTRLLLIVFDDMNE